MATINAVGLQKADFTNTGNWGFDGTNFDVLAGNFAQLDGLHVNIGISAATSMNIANISCPVIMNAEAVTLGSNAADFTIQSTNKIFAIAQGKLNLISVTDSVEINSFGNLQGKGDGIVLDVNTASVAHIQIGFTEAKAMDIGNASCVTTWNFNGLSALGTGNVLLGTSSGTADYGSMSGDCGIHGTNINVKADVAGAVNILSDGAGTVNINGSGAGGGVINIATNLVPTLNVGTSACAIVGNASTFSWDAASTLHLGAGGALTIGSGASVSVSAPSLSINTDALTNTTTVGHVTAGNNVTINSVLVAMPNLPTASGGEKVLMIDTSNGQIRISP